MEINVKDMPGSIAGGGRYDNLIGMFLGSEVPACGFSLGLERILVVMQERGMFPPDVEQASIDVVVAALDESAQCAAMETAAELRRSGDAARRSVSGRREENGQDFQVRRSAPCEVHRDSRRRRSGGGHGDGAKRCDEDAKETMAEQREAASFIRDAL